MMFVKVFKPAFQSLQQTQINKFAKSISWDSNFKTRCRSCILGADG